MEIKILRVIKHECKFLKIQMPARCLDRDHLRVLTMGSMAIIVIDVDTGRVVSKLEGLPGVISARVLAEGSYILLDPERRRIAKKLRSYVPKGLFPGPYDPDELNFYVDKNGFINDWETPDLRDFTVDVNASIPVMQE